jgi:hypothetical protein
VLLDEPQGFRCVEVRHPDEFTAAEEPGVTHGKRCIVIERSGIKQRAARLDAKADRVRIDDGWHMIEDDFWSSGGTA